MMDRRPGLDVLRALAALAVVFLHASAQVVISDPDPARWLVAVATDSIVRWCVPVFVMMSGALLLPSAMADRPEIFLKRRLPRIAVPLLVWTFLYLSIDRELDNSLAAIWLGQPHYHLWYLYMCLGLYAFAPLIGRVLQADNGLDQRWKTIYVLAAFVLAAVGAVTFAEQTPAALLFVGYSSYFCAGYLLSQQPVRLGPPAGILLALFASGMTAVAAVLLKQQIPERGIQIAFSNFSPFVGIAAVALFEGFRGINSTPRFVRVVSDLTLGIYVLHPIFLKLLKIVGIDGMHLGPVVGIPSAAFLAFVASAGVTALIRRVPGGRWIA